MRTTRSRDLALLTLALTCAACDDDAMRALEPSPHADGALKDAASPVDASVDTGLDASAEAGDPRDAAPDGQLALLPLDAFVPEKVCGEADTIVHDELPEMGCTRLRGTLSFENYFPTTLPASVQTLERIDGRLNFFRPFNLTNLRGLDRLRVVGGEVFIRLDNADKLSSLDGLGSLREVGELLIEDNGGLTSLSGLAALETVRGDLSIRENRALPKAEVDALLARVRVGGAATSGNNGL